MKKMIVTLALLSVAALSTGCATTGDHGTGNSVRTQTYYVDARVVEVQPAPQICDYGRKKSDKSKPLLGGVIGGLIGNQFGKGGGRKLATVGGVLVGAVLSTERDPRKTTKTMKCRSDGYVASVQYLHPVNGSLVMTQIPMENRVRLSRREDTYVSIPVSVSMR